MADTMTTGTYDLSELADFAGRDMQALVGDDLDPTLRQVVSGPIVPATLRQLDRGGITSLDTPTLDGMDPADRLSTILRSGAQALRENGLPDPDLDMYHNAGAIASQTGVPLNDVVSEFERVMPETVGALQSAEDGVSLMQVSDTIVAPAGQSAAASLEGVEPQDYREYDVHFMMYPLGHDILGTGLETRPSHGFIVVTDKDVDPTTLRAGDVEALVVTRGGPDAGYLDFRFDTNVQSPTEKTRDGDVYIADHDGSSEDLNAGGVRLIETTTIVGNIEDIQTSVEDFRQAVNSTDINYHAPYQNSNTYAGDVYTNLTGEPAPDTVQWPHYMPGLGNDLPVEGDFSYRPEDHDAGFGAGL